MVNFTNFIELLIEDQSDFSVKVSKSGSAYVQVWIPNGPYLDSLTVRFSDHEHPTEKNHLGLVVGGGGKVTVMEAITLYKQCFPKNLGFRG